MTGESYIVQVQDDVMLSTSDPAAALDRFQRLTDKHTCVVLWRQPDYLHIASQFYYSRTGTLRRQANIKLLASLGLPTVLWAQRDLDFEEPH